MGKINRESHVRNCRDLVNHTNDNRGIKMSLQDWVKKIMDQKPLTNKRETVKKEGEYVSKNIDLPSFNEIQCGGVLQIYWTNESSSGVISGPENIIDLFEFTIRSGKLIISCNENFTTSKVIRLNLSCSDLHKINLCGACVFHAESPINGSAFQVELNGASQAIIKGKSCHLDVKGQGASRLDASGFECEYLKVKGDGAFHAKGMATKEANLNLSGAAHVELSGEHTLKVELSGAASFKTEERSPTRLARAGSFGGR